MTFEEAFAELTKYGEHFTIQATHFESGEVAYYGLMKVRGGLDNVQVHHLGSWKEVVSGLGEKHSNLIAEDKAYKISKLKAELAKLEGEAA